MFRCSPKTCHQMRASLLTASSDWTSYPMILLSFTPATSSGTLPSCDVITFSTRPGLESNPNPIGKEIDNAGRASNVLEMTAVARLHLLRKVSQNYEEGKEEKHLCANSHGRERILAFPCELLEVVHHADSPKLFLRGSGQHIFHCIIFADLCSLESIVPFLRRPRLGNVFNH